MIGMKVAQDQGAQTPNAALGQEGEDAGLRDLLFTAQVAAGVHENGLAPRQPQQDRVALAHREKFHHQPAALGRGKELDRRHDGQADGGQDGRGGSRPAQEREARQQGTEGQQFRRAKRRQGDAGARQRGEEARQDGEQLRGPSGDADEGVERRREDEARRAGERAEDRRPQADRNDHHVGQERGEGDALEVERDEGQGGQGGRGRGDERGCEGLQEAGEKRARSRPRQQSAQGGGKAEHAGAGGEGELKRRRVEDGRVQGHQSEKGDGQRGPAVGLAHEAAGEKEEGRADSGPHHRRLGAGEGGIEGSEGEDEDRGPAVGVDAAEESKKRAQQPEGAEDADGQVQAGNGEDVGEAAVGEGLAQLGGDEGLLPDHQGRNQGARFRRSKDLACPVAEFPPPDLDAGKEPPRLVEDGDAVSLHARQTGDAPSAALLEGPARHGRGGRRIVDTDAGPEAIAREGKELGRKRELEARRDLGPRRGGESLVLRGRAGALQPDGGAGPPLAPDGCAQDDAFDLQASRRFAGGGKAARLEGPGAGPGRDAGPAQIDVRAQQVPGPEIGEGEEKDGKDAAPSGPKGGEDERGKDRPAAGVGKGPAPEGPQAEGEREEDERPGEKGRHEWGPMRKACQGRLAQFF